MSLGDVERIEWHRGVGNRFGMDQRTEATGGKDERRLPVGIFLEQRGKDNSCRTSVLEGTQGVHGSGQRTRRGHDGVGETEPEVGGRQVDAHCGVSSLALALALALALSKVPGTERSIRASCS